jgi:hypothetical protein
MLSAIMLTVVMLSVSAPLSDASFLGKLIALPAIVRLDWKVIASYKHSSLFGLVISDEGKKFYNIDIWPKIPRLSWLIVAPKPTYLGFFSD